MGPGGQVKLWKRVWGRWILDTTVDHRRWSWTCAYQYNCATRLSTRQEHGQKISTRLCTRRKHGRKYCATRPTTRREHGHKIQTRTSGNVICESRTTPPTFSVSYINIIIAYYYIQFLTDNNNIRVRAMTLCGMSIFVLVVVIVPAITRLFGAPIIYTISAPTPFPDFRGRSTARVYRCVSVGNRALHGCDIPAKRIDTRRNFLFENLADFYNII